MSNLEQEVQRHWDTTNTFLVVGCYLKGLFIYPGLTSKKAFVKHLYDLSGFAPFNLDQAWCRTKRRIASLSCGLLDVQ